MNCKPSDLAVVINAVVCPENIGRIVRILRPAVSGEVLRPGGAPLTVFSGRAWVAEAVGSPLVERNIFGSEERRVPYRAFRDSDLKPVSGLEDTETSEDSTPIKDKMHL